MRIACVHQGYELYGSDRCFAESVAALRHAYPQADIEVVLPRPGPITTLLDGNASRIVFERLWVLRRRKLLLLATIGVARLPGAVMRAARRFRDCDVVYINTAVVVDHLLAARWFRRRAVVHVHEIPAGAALAILRRLIGWSGARIVFNSRATRAAYGVPAWLTAPVIYNGIKGPPEAEPTTYDATRPLRVLMLGRVNRIKGQEVLLEAVAALPAELRARLAVRIVGSAFRGPGPRGGAAGHASHALGLAEIVSIEPFVADTAPLYRWADIVVVPSRLAGIARSRRHRGNVVRTAAARLVDRRPRRGRSQDGTTGWLVPPGRADALTIALGTDHRTSPKPGPNFHKPPRVNAIATSSVKRQPPSAIAQAIAPEIASLESLQQSEAIAAVAPT